MPEELKKILIYLLKNIDSNDIDWDYDWEEAINIIEKKLTN